MRLPLLRVLLGGALASFALGVHADGCIKGAAVGAVGGHLAHHHGILGAAVGCAVGHHMAKKKSGKQVTAPRASKSAQNNDGLATPVQPNSKEPVNP